LSPNAPLDPQCIINVWIATATESVSLCAPMKSWLRLWNLNRRVGC